VCAVPRSQRPNGELRCLSRVHKGLSLQPISPADRCFQSAQTTPEQRMSSLVVALEDEQVCARAQLQPWAHKFACSQDLQLAARLVRPRAGGGADCAISLLGRQASSGPSRFRRRLDLAVHFDAVPAYAQVGIRPASCWLMFDPVCRNTIGTLVSSVHLLRLHPEPVQQVEQNLGILPTDRSNCMVAVLAADFALAAQQPLPTGGHLFHRTTVCQLLPQFLLVNRSTRRTVAVAHAVGGR